MNVDLPEFETMKTSQTRPFDTGGPQIRRVYDVLAPLYPLSSRLFHSRAHKAALCAANIRNGMQVLEAGMGSGEMFKHLVRANPHGHTVGVDLSPKMAARSQEGAREKFPGVLMHCQAADVTGLPFASGSFDAVVCCFLFELLPETELRNSLAELSRVLRPGGKFVTTLVGQNKSSFNAMYKVCNRVAPAFWGRQVGAQVVNLLGKCGYTIDTDHHVGQVHYTSRIVSATRSTASDHGLSSGSANGQTRVSNGKCNAVAAGSNVA